MDKMYTQHLCSNRQKKLFPLPRRTIIYVVMLRLRRWKRVCRKVSLSAKSCYKLMLFQIQGIPTYCHPDLFSNLMWSLDTSIVQNVIGHLIPFDHTFEYCLQSKYFEENCLKF